MQSSDSGTPQSRTQSSRSSKQTSDLIASKQDKAAEQANNSEGNTDIASLHDPNTIPSLYHFITIVRRPAILMDPEPYCGLVVNPPRDGLGDAFCKYWPLSPMKSDRGGKANEMINEIIEGKIIHEKSQIAVSNYYLLTIQVTDAALVGRHG